MKKGPLEVNRAGPRNEQKAKHLRTEFRLANWGQST